MSKIVYLFSFLLLTLFFTSCSETKEVSKYDNWQARSVNFIDSIANVYNSPENKTLPDNDPKKLYAILDPTNYQTIYVNKIKKSGTSTDIPFYTSTVSVYYRMSYFNRELVQQNFKGEEPNPLFDTPAEFTLNSVITGWGYALQEMEVGDFWTLYIPYQSGYDSGTGSDGSLQPYSALIYNVQLAKIVEQ